MDRSVARARNAFVLKGWSMLELEVGFLFRWYRRRITSLEFKEGKGELERGNI
jgi:hypothetical protein